MIGRECSLAYAREGAHVAVADIKYDGAQNTAADLPVERIALRCGVSDGASVETAINQTVSKFSSLDAVHNNAGRVLHTGALWADVPERYPSYQTCHRRFQQWVRAGVMKGVLEALALDLKIRGAPDVFLT